MTHGLSGGWRVMGAKDARRTMSRPVFSLLQLIERPLGRIKSLAVLNERLIDDAAEIGTIAVVAGGQNLVGDFRHLHRPAGFGKNIGHHITQRPVVAGPPAAPAAASATEPKLSQFPVDL